MNEGGTLCRIGGRIGEGITAAFYAAFLFLFTFVALGVLFGSVGYEYNHFLLFALVVLFVLLTAAVCYAVRNYAALLVKWQTVILVLLLGAFFIIQMYLGARLRFESAFDFAAVYRGAAQWAATGTFADYYEYYQYFPNNLGAMTLLFLFYKAAGVLGMTDYFMLGVFLNGVLISLTILFSYLAAKRIAGPAGGFLCLFFFLASPPFYILAAAFYTDALSMLFPVLFFYLYLRLRGGGLCRNQRKLLYIAMALVVTLGAAVKFTVMIMAAAVVIDLFLRGKARQACALAAAVCACFLVFRFAFDSYLYRYHLDREQAALMNTPLTHWVMMGLNPASGGAYHPEDYTFTRSFTNPEERNAAIRDKIRQRLKENGFDGLTRLFAQKTTKAFGDGTYAISDFLDDGPARRGRLHEYVLYDGACYPRYQYAAQTVLITVYLFAAAGCALALKRRDKSVTAMFIAIFGLILFLAVWESSSRYFANYIPVLFLCAAYGGSAVTKR